MILRGLKQCGTIHGYKVIVVKEDLGLCLEGVGGRVCWLVG